MADPNNNPSDLANGGSDLMKVPPPGELDDVLSSINTDPRGTNEKAGHTVEMRRTNENTEYLNHGFIPDTDNVSRASSTLSLTHTLSKDSRASLVKRKSTHQLTEKEKEVMSKFSSVNYSPAHSVAYMDWLKDHPPVRYQWDRWLLLILVAITIGVLAWLQKQCLELLNKWKWDKGQEYTREDRLLEAFGWVAAIASIYMVVGSFLVVFVHQPAAGSGVPEVISYLNGVVVHGTLTLKNLIVKFFANVLATSTGLPCAIQGPMIAMGAVIGVGMGQFKSRTLRFTPNIFSRFRNAEDRRAFTTAGVAAGVAAAFNAPMGGLMFAMEDLTSFWSKRISWQTFFCAGIAAITANMLNTSFTAFSYHGSFGLLSMALTEPLQLHIAVLLPAIVLGLTGGVLGGLFIRLNALVIQTRKKFLANFSSSIVVGCIRIFEVVIMVLVMVATAVYLPDAFDCAQQDFVFNDTRTIQACYAIIRNSTAVDLEQYNCPVVSNSVPSNHTFIYSEVATLMQGSGTRFLDQLLTRGTHRWFGYGPMLAILPIWYFMIIWSCGSAFAGGIFIPNMITGGLYGRILGLGMIDIYEAVTGDPIPTGTDWDWMDPGLIAAIGAGSMLGGTTRLCLAVTIITVEMSEDIDLTVSILVAIYVAKIVADMISQPLYYYQLRGKSMPYLQAEPEVTIAGKLVNLDTFKVKDIMSQPVLVLHATEAVSTLARVLLDSDHGGFPVVKYDEETRTELVYGFITRTELYVIMCSDEVYNENKPGAIVKPQIDYQDISVDFIPDPSFSVERVRSYGRFQVFHKIFVDLEPFINISAPKIDEDYSVLRTFMLFRTLGLRHLVITDVRNRVTGIITRKDLMAFRIEEKLLELEDEAVADENANEGLPTVSLTVGDAGQAHTAL